MATQAAPPRSVGLLSFTVTALPTAVSLEWETATELNTLGFIVKRSVNGGPFISLPDIGMPGFTDADGNPAGFVGSEGGPAMGASYQETDYDVQAGNSYTYKLIEIENNFNEVELDVQSITFGSAPTDTPTAQASPTNTLAPTATATPTLLPTSTQPPTSTPRPTATSTQPARSNPTATAVATATPTTAIVPTSSPTIAPTAQAETAVGSSANSNTALAQVEATATAVPPTPTTETDRGENGYPAPQTEAEPTVAPPTPTPAPLEATPYVAPTRQTDGGERATAVPIIGNQNNNQTDSNRVSSSQETSNRNEQLGRIYLWGGFLLSLLIFITAVVATILLFTRKRTQ